MAVIAPTPIDSMPPVPSSSDPDETFDPMFEAFHGNLRNSFQPQANALASNVFNNATEAVNAATTAIAEADLAMGYRNTANSAASAAVTAAGTATTKAAEADASAVQASKLNLGPKSSPPAVDNQGAALLQGATYYDTALGKWRAWNGSTWIDPVSVTAGVTSLNGQSGALTLQYGMRNRILNGGFAINQRAYVSGAATTAGQYTLDRWKVTGTGGITFATTNNKTTVTIPSGQTLQQIIEGLNLQTGTYVLSWEGTAQGRIAGGSYGASGAVTASITGGTNTAIEFNAGTVANVQLEPGTFATPFESRPFGVELDSCRRYYQAYYGSGTGVALAARGSPGAGNALWLSLILPIEMRSAPTAAVVGAWAVSNCPQPTISQASKSNVTVFSNTSGAGDAYFFSASTTAGVTLSAEL